jgi:hypothetical protein
MSTPQQQQEFEAAIQQHIQQAVAAALAGMPQPAAPTPPTVNVNAVAVKLTDFWPADPQTWFHQAEAAFRRSNVTTSFTKYDHVLMKLPTDVVMSVRDLVNTMQPNTPDAYEQLKARLTTSYGKTKWQQVNALLDMPPLGDRRPSHLLNEMLALLPTGENKDGAIFLGIFLRKLPTTMRDHLAAANHTTAAAMSAHADVLWDARCGDPTVNHLVDANTAAVAAMNVSRDSRRRSPDRRSPDRRRRQSRPGRRSTPGPDSRRRDTSAFCYYHSRFGQKALKCEAPCSWTEN